MRGDKSRFQLFGDSGRYFVLVLVSASILLSCRLNLVFSIALVNTASRMESNGVKGKIHCSAATAEVLRKGGKDHWLKLREDKIEVKGKGEM